MQRGNDCKFQSAGFIGFWRLGKFKRNNRRERGFVCHEHIGLNIKHNVSQPDAFAGFDAGVENRSVHRKCPGNLDG